MTLVASVLVGKMKSKLSAKGFVLDNEHSKQTEFLEAIAEAVVEEIQANAKVVDPGGQSPGLWSIT